jgi:PAS domain S-box-containing protein
VLTLHRFPDSRAAQPAASSGWGESAIAENGDPFCVPFAGPLKGMFQTTPDGHYIRANRALAELYGYASPAELLEEVTDIGGQLYVDPARRDEFIGLMREEGLLSGFDSEIRRRDGSVIWISEACREVRSAAGELVYYEGTVEDITERKLDELELGRARELAERSSRAEAVLLANMSHELRTPLNQILGYAEIFERELFGPIGDPRYVEFARDIHQSGRQLLDIIGDILDLAKAEAGQVELDDSRIDVGELLASAGRAIAQSAQERAVAFTIEPPPVPVTILGDPMRLRKILLSLLSNAVKFTPAGKSVILSCGRAGDGFFLRIADAGIGMTAEEIESAMRPFHQIDTSLARQYVGPGLGLPLTQSLMRLHGGWLEIESAPGEGTVATAVFPAERLLAWGD